MPRPLSVLKPVMLWQVKIAKKPKSSSADRNAIAGIRDNPVHRQPLLMDCDIELHPGVTLMELVFHGSSVC